MRFVDCPNCFSSHSDESDESFNRKVPNKKTKKLKKLANVIFGSNNTIKKSTGNNGLVHYSRKPHNAERKHKIKKRDLVLSQQRGASGTGSKYLIIWQNIFYF